MLLWLHAKNLLTNYHMRQSKTTVYCYLNKKWKGINFTMGTEEEGRRPKGAGGVLPQVDFDTGHLGVSMLAAAVDEMVSASIEKRRNETWCLCVCVSVCLCVCVQLKTERGRRKKEKRFKNVKNFEKWLYCYILLTVTLHASASGGIWPVTMPGKYSTQLFCFPSILLDLAVKVRSQ